MDIGVKFFREFFDNSDNLYSSFRVVLYVVIKFSGEFFDDGNVSFNFFLCSNKEFFVDMLGLMLDLDLECEISYEGDDED